MFIVALTGGIGSGKSTVSDLFAQLGVPVIDMDIIAREVVAAGSPALESIKQEFGPQAIDGNGQLDRTYMREMIFCHNDKRKKLESILHPIIRSQAFAQAAQTNFPYVIMVIPLLAESEHDYTAINRTLVVDVPVEIQLTRTMQRDNIDRAAAEKILASQADRDARLKIADDVLVNTSSQNALKARVKELHEKYLALAANNTA